MIVLFKIKALIYKSISRQHQSLWSHFRLLDRFVPLKNLEAAQRDGGIAAIWLCLLYKNLTSNTNTFSLPLHALCPCHAYCWSRSQALIHSNMCTLVMLELAASKCLHFRRPDNPSIGTDQPLPSHLTTKLLSPPTRHSGDDYAKTTLFSNKSVSILNCSIIVRVAIATRWGCQIMAVNHPGNAMWTLSHGIVFIVCKKYLFSTKLQFLCEKDLLSWCCLLVAVLLFFLPCGYCSHFIQTHCTLVA